MIDALACIGRPPEAREHRHNPSAGHAPSIAPTATVEAFVTVDAGVERPTYVGSRAWLMKHVHVGHDAYIGAGCELAPGTVIGGYAEVHEGVKIGVNATILPRKVIGPGARIGAGAVVTKDVPAGETWVGNPARPLVKKEAAGWEAFDTGADPHVEGDEWTEWWDRSRA